MLKKIHITNFLSCKDTEMELDNVTALIGRNAAGKTNILKAIQWCAQFAVGNMPLDGVFSRIGKLKTEFNIEFLIGNETFKYEIDYSEKSFGLLVSASDKKESSILIENIFCHKDGEWQLIAKRNNDHVTHYNEEETGLDIKPQAPVLVSMISLLPEKTLNLDIKNIFNYFSTIKYYTLENDKYTNDGFFLDLEYIKWLSEINETDSSSEMKLLHLWHADKDTLDELKALIGKNGLNLIDNIIIEKLSYGEPEEEKCFYIIRFNIGNTFVCYSQLSYGTQRVLIILLALLYDKNSTLLIEQPEDGIHSGLLRKLLPLCFEYGAVYNKQIIITTHSPDVINLLPPESIRLVKMTENGTKVSSLNEEQLPFIYEFLEDEGALFDFIESMDDE